MVPKKWIKPFYHKMSTSCISRIRTILWKEQTLANLILKMILWCAMILQKWIPQIMKWCRMISRTWKKHQKCTLMALYKKKSILKDLLDDAKQRRLDSSRILSQIEKKGWSRWEAQLRICSQMKVLITSPKGGKRPQDIKSVRLCKVTAHKKSTNFQTSTMKRPSSL